LLLLVLGAAALPFQRPSAAKEALVMGEAPTTLLVASAQLMLDAEVQHARAAATPGPVVAPPAMPPVSGGSAAPVDPSSLAWAKNVRETGLWSGPSEGTLFTKVPEGALFKVLEQGASRYKVYFPGDRTGRAAGEAWIDAADLRGEAWPRWVRLRQGAALQAQPEAGAPVVGSAPARAFVEVLAQGDGRWARVYYLGDGRRPALEGWLEASPAYPLLDTGQIASFALTQERLAAGGPAPWISIPYRSQLDGSPFAAANCGPTTINMVLESFGIQISQAELRRQVLALQDGEDCDECGVFIQNLAEVIQRHGLKVHRLRDDDPEAFHRWTLEEIRAEIRAGRPVVPQVFYRGLPARGNSGYWGDHYVVLTGLMGDNFVFNDPIDVEGPGFARIISASALAKAMDASDFPFAAFSVSR
jgi:hypothetical protein